MKKNTHHNHVFNGVLIGWFVLSAGYIAMQLWNNGQGAMYQAGIAEGQRSAVAQIIAQSQQCQPFNVFVGQAGADLINVACLQQAAQPGQGDQSGAPAPEGTLAEEQ